MFELPHGAPLGLGPTTPPVDMLRRPEFNHHENGEGTAGEEPEEELRIPSPDHGGSTEHGRDRQDPKEHSKPHT